MPKSKHLHISTFACVRRRLGVTISWLKRSVECLDAGHPGWRGWQDRMGTPPVTGQSHSGLGGASLCWAAHAVVSPFSGHSTEPERLQVVRDGFAWGGGGQGGVRGSLSERDEDTAILLLHG